MKNKIRLSLLTVIILLAGAASPAPGQSEPQNAPPPGYPQGGYPQQGAPPPQGYPPQGAPPPQQGYPPQGAPPQGPPPPSYSPAQLDQMVASIALYPDPLLAQILAGATFPDQIPDAARWADQHHYLSGQALASAIQADQLPWDPSVQALLPFPSVLGMMASNINWTSDLGNAFLASQQSVMDAVQRQRRIAMQYGYLRSNAQIVVGVGPYVTIMPVNPDYMVVPYYDPRIVFFPPRPGFFIGGGIRFGFGITLGAFFRPWGWGYSRFDWGGHALFIDNARWGRTWYNRRVYAHPYPGIRRYGPGAARPPEHHEAIERSPREREAERQGRRPEEEHHGGGHDNHDRR